MKAFPQAQFRGDEPVDTEEHGGMDLRDHFAGLAMQAYVEIYEREHLNDGVLKSDRDIAFASYKIADKMMEARNDR